jgi:hypothetical protein
MISLLMPSLTDYANELTSLGVGREEAVRHALGVSVNYVCSSLTAIVEDLKALGLDGEQAKSLAVTKVFGTTVRPILADPADGEIAVVPAAPAEAPFLKLETRWINFSSRARTVLDSMHIHTVGDLLRHTPTQIRMSKNCGAKTLQEIRMFVSRIGMATGEWEE